MSSTSPQVASLLNKVAFPFYQHLSLEYWLSSGEQPNLSSVTLGVPRTTLKGKLLHSWLQSIVIGHRLISANEKGTKGKAQEEPGASVLSVELDEDALNSLGNDE